MADLAVISSLETRMPAVPSLPHMEAEGLDFFEDRLRRTQCLLEYGAGGSTRLAARLGVPRILSVESDLAFGQAVATALRQEEPGCDFELCAPDLGPTGAWGYPTDPTTATRWPLYATRPWERLARRQWVPDLILVDGRFRVACFLASLLQARPGVVILFDDYAGRRKQYGVVERHLPITRMAGRAAVFEVPQVLDPRRVAMDLAKYAVNPV
ncbi:MAG: hypothetical protein K5Q68_09365 [Roseococcus sp.]|nr:hypothetical protein [Roseococcus sp.]